MNLKDAAQEVKIRWRDFLPLVLDLAKEKVNNEPSYICPFCGHGSHGDGLTYNPKSKTKTGLVCFNTGCQFSGSDIDLYARMTGRDANDTAQYVETVKEMAGMLNIAIDDQPPSVKEAPSPTESGKDVAESIVDPPRTPNTPGKYKNRILYAADDLYSDAGKDALSYLHNRGFSDETLKKYMIGYRATGEYFVKAHKEMPAVIFPHDAGGSYYSSRSTTGKFFNKLAEAEAGSQTLYNGAALNQNQPIFITEGQLDALSVLQSGGNAVALAGGKWESVLLTRIAQKPPAAPLVLALDNDETNEQGHNPGQESQEALAEALTERGIPFIIARFSLDQYSQPVKDCNDMLQDNPGLLKADVARIEAEALRAMKPDNTADYIAYEMPGEIERMQRDGQRKTGFSNLDAIIGSLYSGLIVIPGISSVGKSAFSGQLSDQLAKGGQHVLLFSMEMSRLEMISRSISRYTRMQGAEGAVTSFQIRTGKKAGGRIEKATQQYLADVGDRISIIEGNFDSDTTAITDYAKNYVARNGITPVIVVDYLQVLQPAADPQTGRKPTDSRTAIDNSVIALKRLSRDLSTPVVVVSSVNRSNYLAPLDFESIKESGCVEFSADCIYGLQLACMNESLFTTEKESLVKKRERVKQAKAEMPRKIELTCLKNRYGASGFSCLFDYEPMYDYFIPLEADFEPVGEETPYDLPLF